MNGLYGDARKEQADEPPGGEATATECNLMRDERSGIDPRGDEQGERKGRESQGESLSHQPLPDDDVIHHANANLVVVALPQIVVCRHERDETKDAPAKEVGGIECELIVGQYGQVDGEDKHQGRDEQQSEESGSEHTRATHAHIYNKV